MRTVRLLLGTAGIGALVGCSAVQGPAPAPSPSDVLPSPSVSVVETSDSGEEKGADDLFSVQRNATDAFGPLPLEAFRPTIAENYLLDSAVYALVDECMAEFGFPPMAADVVGNFEEQVIIERESRNRLFGIVDVDQAAVSGYLPAWVLVSNKQDREKALGRGEFSESSTAQEFVRTGLKPGDGPDDQTASPGEIDGKEVPPNGCVGQAREQVYETNTIMARFTFGQDLHLSVWDEAAVDPRTVAVDKKWQTCMADAGFQMGAKWDWDDRFTGIPETERPTEEERRQAVADATCNLEWATPTRSTTCWSSFRRPRSRTTSWR